MFKQTILLFLSLGVVLSHQQTEPDVVEGMFNKLQKDLFKPKQCFTKLMGFYLESDGPSMSFTAGDNVHDLCPSIMQSCCSFEQLVEIHGKARNSHLKMLKFGETLIGLMNSVADLSDERLQNLRNAISQKGCEGDEEDGNFNMAQEFLGQNREVLSEGIRSGLLWYSTKMAGYACTMCDQTSHESIVEKRKQAPYIMVDLKQCKTFFGDAKIGDFLNTVIALKQVGIAFREMSCALGKPSRIPIDDLINPEQYDLGFNFYQDCASKNKLETDQPCQRKCEEMNIFNESFFSKYMQDLIAFDFLKENLLVQETADTESMKEMFDKRLEEEFVHFWVEPLRTKTRIEKLEKKYVYGSGWNTMNHFFVDKPAELQVSLDGRKSIILRGSASKYSVLGLLVFWLVFHK